MPTVLLIEDDAESRRATAHLFTRENWTILEAGDGEAGISLALGHRPELILCDLLMPRANGSSLPHHSPALQRSNHRRVRPRLRCRSQQRDRGWCR
jgi:CheY-like chemotaxis protein